MSTPTDNSICFHQSVAGFLFEKSSGLNVKEEDNCIKAAAKYTVGALVHTTLTAIALVEMIARNALAIVAKIFQFIFPKGYSETIDNYILKPAIHHAQLATEYTAKAATNIVTSFMQDETRENADKTIQDGVSNFYNSNLMNSLAKFHFNGFSMEKENSSEAEQVPPKPTKAAPISVLDLIAENEATRKYEAARKSLEAVD